VAGKRLLKLLRTKPGRYVQGGQHLTAGSLSFKNNYAINDSAAGMPARDFTVEFWGRTPAVKEGLPPPPLYSEFFSYAGNVQQPGEYNLPCLYAGLDCI